MWKPPELSVSGGFFLIVGWFAVSCGGEAALLVLSAALLHELGHILALRLSGAGTAGGVNRRSAAGENILAILSLLLEI